MRMIPINCVCTQCGKSYQKLRARGYMDRCVACHKRMRVRAWKLAHPERARELNRNWAAENPQKDRASKSAYNARNRNALNAKSVAWQKANPERVREIARRSAAKKRAQLAPIRAAKAAERLANRSRQAIASARCVARKLGLPLPALPPRTPPIYRGNCKTCDVEVIRKKADGRTDRCNKCRSLELNRIERVARRDREAKVIPAWADRGAIAAIYTMASRASRCTGIPFHVDHVIPIRGRRVTGLHVPENLAVISKAENLRKNRRFEVA